MSLDSWAEDLLPTKWSRRIALATLALTVAGFGSLSLLPTSFLPASTEHTFALRLLVSAIVLAIGSIVVLVLVVRSHTAQAKRIAELEHELAARPPKNTNIQSLPPLNYDNRGIV